MDTATFPDPEHLSESISSELGAFIQSRSSTFACGGVIPIKVTGDNNTNTSQDATAPPVILRWDSNDSPSGIAKLKFPVDAANSEDNAGLLKLMRDCQPASFGYKGEDVIDESYRKATKMDRTAFSTDFCPYELGIVDTIAQVLLPNAGRAVGTKGVKAELYKLNTYAAPSGFFKPHVDTPRSETQFGSLVVSLPCHHEGGHLIVRHAEHSLTFDWGAPNPAGMENSIQWAAFYSDCEHEVLEVTAGHRITLTYNLYYTPGLGDLAGNSPAMCIRSLPLYHKVQEALSAPRFMPEGGYLGIYCKHAYAHSTAEGAKALPAILKGSDMAVYSVFLALGLDISVRPILDHRSSSQYDYFEENAYDYMERDNPGSLYDSDGNINPWIPRPKPCTHDYVGELGEVVVTETGGFDGEGFEDVLGVWDGHVVKINWLTEKQWRNVGMVHMTYGNEAGIGTLYTYAALVVTVPPAQSRGGTKEQPIALD